MSNWFKSSYSANIGQCVETRFNPEWAIENTVLVRNSKSPEGSFVMFTKEEWEAFIVGVKDGEFDWPAQRASE